MDSQHGREAAFDESALRAWRVLCRLRLLSASCCSCSGSLLAEVQLNLPHELLIGWRAGFVEDGRRGGRIFDRAFLANQSIGAHSPHFVQRGALGLHLAAQLVEGIGGVLLLAEEREPAKKAPLLVLVIQIIGCEMQPVELQRRRHHFGCPFRGH